MTLKAKQSLLFLLCSIIVMLLFFFGATKTPVDAKSEIKPAIAKQQETDFKLFEVSALNNLTAERKDSLKNLSVELKEANIKGDKEQLLEKIAERWLKYGNPDMNAYYTLQKAELSEEDLDAYESLHKMDAAIEMSPDSLAKSYFLDKSIGLYNKLEEKYPDSLSFAINRARLLIDKKQQVMQGVLILRDVIEKDSLNLQANFTLGKLSVVSGQFDKAVKRMKTVLKQNKGNTEALYFLGEAYLGLGRKQDAIATFEKCKALVDSPLFKKEIDKYINSIINQ